MRKELSNLIEMAPGFITLTEHHIAGCVTILILSIVKIIANVLMHTNFG